MLEQKEEVQLSYAEKAAAAKVLLEQYDADGVRRPASCFTRRVVVPLRSHCSRALRGRLLSLQNGALNFEELQSMAGQNNLDRPGGLDEKQFTDKFDTRITREGKYQTKVRLATLEVTGQRSLRASRWFEPLQLTPRRTSPSIA